MSTFVLLSSSPPKVFAKSPTPADSSSPYLPPTSELFQSQSQRSPRFKTSKSVRDGFSEGFTSAKLLLQQKHTAENVPVKVAKSTKFRTSVSCAESDTRSREQEEAFVWQDSASNPHLPRTPKSPTRNPLRALCDEVEKSKQVSNILTDGQSQVAKPLCSGTTIARRLDWTPVKERTRPADEKDESPKLEASFPKGLLQSFEFCQNEINDHIIQDAIRIPTKRRRLIKDTKTEKRPKKQRAQTERPQKPAVPKKRNKSPAKKGLTITGLATSLYRGETIAKETPILQYLTSTQARAVDYSLAEEATEAPEKKIAATEKKRPTKKTKSKLQLLSPTSAMKAFEAQETLFGSASQLARDESPRLTRDTLEALRLSTTNIMSDPISTQQTQPVSIKSTSPSTRRGTSRYAKTRNLWAAAGRDEDNALLQVETIDLCDTPDVRRAFAGKDVLVELGSLTTVQDPTSIRSNKRSFPYKDKCKLYDIDDFTTPTHTKEVIQVQKRSFHSSVSIKKAGNNTQPALGSPAKQQAVLDKPLNPQPALPKPVKPVYSAFTTAQLQKQISSYGFKPIKRKDKMVELLDRCWEDKYGPSEAQTSNELIEECPMMKQGDFLSKLHDISARPTPKVKKTKKDAKNEPSTKRTRKPASSKKPRQSKGKEDNVPKVVDEVDDKEPFVSEPAREKTAKQKKSSSIADRTPPATASLETSTDIAPTMSERAVILTPEIPLEHISINDQIKKAILHDDNQDIERNHVMNPTWHEKILMFDPIILEDLTLWLNTQGFRQICEDREVSTLEVRSWCESHGICCLWKGGWRGQKSHASQA